MGDYIIQFVASQQNNNTDVWSVIAILIALASLLLSYNALRLTVLKKGSRKYILL